MERMGGMGTEGDGCLGIGLLAEPTNGAFGRYERGAPGRTYEPGQERDDAPGIAPGIARNVTKGITSLVSRCFSHEL